MDDIRRLLIVSHVAHTIHGGKLYAYGPYVYEIDMWADLFEEILIAAPCTNKPPAADWAPFTRSNVTMVPQKQTGGAGCTAKLLQFLCLPGLIWTLCRAMRRVDAIHVRCPGNLGLLGCILGPLFSPYLVAKYAGQWNGYQGEPWTVRLQRWILRSRWWRGPVTVYGQWPDQPAHVVPFFTSMMTEQQVARAVQAAAVKSIDLPLRVLFSGRLVPGKRPDALIEGAKIAADAGLSMEVVIVGDGPERANLLRQVSELGLEQCVRFTGALPFEESLAWCEWAHCLVLPSQHEGWPKVIAEAMCYGLVCVGMAQGQVPAMLAGRGIVLPSGTPREIADALQTIARSREEFLPVMREASRWARGYSLESLREALADLLAERWNIPRDLLVRGQPSTG